MRKTWKMRAAALLLTAVCTVGASFAAYADDVPSGPASDMELLSEWLSQKAGRKVLVYVPQKGEQAQLVEMCRNNAAEQLAQSIFSRL